MMRSKVARSKTLAGIISNRVMNHPGSCSRRWDRFARFIEDGRICLTNNAAERALRGFALGRKSWLFAGSERGAARAAAMATLIVTAKLNDVDPQAWLADVLARIADTPQNRLHELLPWNRQSRQILMASAA
jgi:transposase